MNSVLKEDIENIASSKLIDWKKLENKTILITGATGLIGSIMVKAIMLRNEKYRSNIKLILLVRELKIAEEMFKKDKNIQYIISTIEKYAPKDLKIDYIIHGASPTKSRFFIKNPVETMDSQIIGTKNILEQAKLSKINSMVLLSSMEMYGTMNLENVTEEDQGFINPLDARSSYSQGKRTCELYSYSYYSEYQVPVKIARIAQTFGAGISKSETRVFKVFADAILNKEDIVLKSDGSTIINYAYTTDTIIGLLYILLNGQNGEAYNLVGEKTNMTILDSAKWLAEQFGEGKVNVKIDIPSEKAGFAPNNKMVLTNDKLKSLGWKPKYTIKQGYKRLLQYMKEEL